MKVGKHLKIASWSSLGEGTEGRREERASQEDRFLELPTPQAKCQSRTFVPLSAGVFTCTCII